MSSTQETSSDTQTVRLVGQVKWFNNKAGYGFITVSDGEQAGKDIFIHYSTIRVTNSQYKYLVQGEYIEFKLISVENSTHEYQAADVGGINGGKLMCETRHEFKLARTNYKNVGATTNEECEIFEPVKLPRQQKVQKDTVSVSVSELPKDLDNTEWSTIQKKTSKPAGRGRPPRTKM
jgi:cold shock CspA family protein